jgi:fructose-bisphosphate aldolase class I
MLFTTPRLNEFISGVILFEETLQQRTLDNVLMPEILTMQGIIPGIKVDKGTVTLATFTGETITQELDSLRERLIEYRAFGARFTKWRAAITIGAGIPTQTCIEANADAVAQFAALSQEAGLVPIVEPEVMMDGNHAIARCKEVTNDTLQAVFAALFKHPVVLEQMFLKTGIVLSGTGCPEPADDETVTKTTLRCLPRVVPAAVPGVVFLSGGQGDQAATQHLRAICRAGNSPWKLSFSFGRALQSSAMKSWQGSPDNVLVAQAALYDRAKYNDLAVRGK